jgi:hypothetical protein
MIDDHAVTAVGTDAVQDGPEWSSRPLSGWIIRRPANLEWLVRHERVPAAVRLHQCVRGGTTEEQIDDAIVGAAGSRRWDPLTDTYDNLPYCEAFVDRAQSCGSLLN